MRFASYAGRKSSTEEAEALIFLLFLLSSSPPSILPPFHSSFLFPPVFCLLNSVFFWVFLAFPSPFEHFYPRFFTPAVYSLGRGKVSGAFLIQS
jgi:hypothetical protein